MLESFLITSRETLEASLVVGIVLAYLNKTNNQDYKKSVYYAILAGILVSIIAAFGFILLAGEFEGLGEQIFEGTTMILGSILITSMILWMMKQRHLTKHIEGKVEKSLLNDNPLTSHLGIFLVVFVAIIREGIETVIFLNAIKYESGISFISGTLGIIAAIAIGILFFLGTKKINLKKLFKISSILLILFAAGLATHGVHEFVEASIIPGIITPLYDSSHILTETSVIGSFMKGLFGYVSDPSLLEVVVYFAYLIGIFFLYRRIGNSKTQSTS